MQIRLAERELHTVFGTFLEILYYDGQQESIALVLGDVVGSSDVLCRIHSACISAHVFNSTECDCREQLAIAQGQICEQGKGILIYLNQEGRGNGHLALMQAAKLSKQENIGQTEAYKRLGNSDDARSFSQAAEILKDLNVESIILLTNNPDKAAEVTRNGVRLNGLRQVLADTGENRQLEKYYLDKLARGHNISF